MNNNKVLIITHTADNQSVDKVIEYIEAGGGTAIRFNADQYPVSSRLSTVYSNNQWQIFYDDGHTTHTLHDATAVWYRRSHGLGKGMKEMIERPYLEAAGGEVRRTLFGMLEGLPCFQLERVHNYRRLDSKEEQLKIALKHGLLVPPTCISNDAARVKAFIDQYDGRVITKMQHAFAIKKEQEELVVYTNELPGASYNDLESLQLCPMVFQQRIDKKLELRVTIVGDKVFAFSIDSQKKENAKVDWRKEGRSMILDWQPYELPPDIQQKLLQFMDDYGVNYGAIDLILTPGDEYYFLETNAAGEYFWLDIQCEFAISRQIADLLMGNVFRRA
jgi:hypothetical protein